MCIICFIKWFQKSERSLVKTNARSRHSSITHRIYIWPFYNSHFIIIATSLVSLDPFTLKFRSSSDITNSSVSIATCTYTCTCILSLICLYDDFHFITYNTYIHVKRILWPFILDLKFVKWRWATRHPREMWTGLHLCTCYNFTVKKKMLALS